MANVAFHFRVEKPVAQPELKGIRNQHLKFCEKLGLDERTVWNLVSIADEITSNFIEHSDATWLDWQMELKGKDQARFVFRDNGRPFDAAGSSDDPGLKSSVDEDRGLGLKLIRRLSKEMSYQRIGEGINEIVLVHKFKD
jgi:anti-sigma regulatory factor (Ser/Thr protein kinase)